MQMTAQIQNNTLIVQNFDLSKLMPFADKNGFIDFDFSILTKALEKETKSLSVDELLTKMTIKTDKVATIDDMNESIAKADENWEV